LPHPPIAKEMNGDSKRKCRCGFVDRDADSILSN
jgi:hypothetical protein